MKLYQPQSISTTNMTRFMEFCRLHYEAPTETYSQFYRWSISFYPEFWKAWIQFSQLILEAPFTSVTDGQSMPYTKWFVDAQINFAKNLLRNQSSNVAIVSYLETGKQLEITYKQLYRQVYSLSKKLIELGIKKGDRVVAFMPNVPETIIAMLATTSLGAVWSSTSPDFGINGVLDRFAQIQPKVLFTTDGYIYKGKWTDLTNKVNSITSALGSLNAVCIVSHNENYKNHLSMDTFYWNKTVKEEDGEIPFHPISFSDPVYIMYSSGTTGLPKCMVQGAGVLVNQTKEHILHTNLTNQDTIFYFTTCGWMMWNWLVSTLFTGAKIVLFDGNPFYPEAGVLWKMAEKEKVTVFGTSAKYLSTLETEKYYPIQHHDLSHVRTLLSTGSPLPPEGFDFVYQSISKKICLSSISGGTDLNGCFALGNPNLPVYRGEIQSRGLGMAVEVWNEDGHSVTQESGELVCVKPFPSMPLYFWNDEGYQKYSSSYFEKYPGIWRHGDFAEITSNDGFIIYGRSDATLNPGGVRIGTSEIYRVVEGIEGIQDSLVVGVENKGDVSVILFVVLDAGLSLLPEKIEAIKKEIRLKTTPRHVPDKIIRTTGVPYTLNMKKVELAVKNILEGKPVKNKEALANPQVLEFYEAIQKVIMGE
jgi:acetoacetyl-CoA synthetase